MDKHTILRDTSFGHRVAEEEVDALAAAQRNRFEKDLAEAKRLLPLLETGGLAAVEKVARRNKGVALVEALRARSWALRHDDPRSMVQYAWLAVRAAQSLDTRTAR